jgi:transcription elongation GreA/GreB family factor
MREEFEKLVVAGKLGRQQVEPLLKLTGSGFCLHRSWGFGKITSVDTVFARLSVDFPGKPGHTMDLGFAADTLRPIGSEHILARKATDLDGLRQMAALHHLDLIKLVLESYHGKASLEQIQQLLVPDVIRDDWKKWWEAARHELKKDGHFLVPLKKTDLIIYQPKEVSLDDRLRTAFRAAKGLKNKVNAATECLKNLADLRDVQALTTEMVAALNADLPAHQRTQPSVALEAVFARDDLRAATDLPPQAGELTSQDIWRQNHVQFDEVMAEMPNAKHRRTLQSFKAALPERWHEVLLAGLNKVHHKICGECAALLVSEGQFPQLKELLARLISQHAASSELLLWLARERSDSFADILGPEVFRAMLTAMERDQFNEKRSNRLRDFIVDDQDLIVELTDAADLEVMKDLTRALQLSPCFDDMSKRSLLGRLVKSHPAVQSLISGEQTKQEAPLFVSWESLERRRNDYTDLVQKRIPANSKEIAIARSYGDLSENHEYKAAKEMQKVLLRRKAELEVMLVRARGTDFAGARTDTVSMGTRVCVIDLDTQQQELITILGAWDSEPEHNVISYQSRLGQALLGRKPREELEFDMDGAFRKLRIQTIEPYRATAPPANPQATGPSSSPIAVAPEAATASGPAFAHPFGPPPTPAAAEELPA